MIRMVKIFLIYGNSLHIKKKKKMDDKENIFCHNLKINFFQIDKNNDRINKAKTYISKLPDTVCTY